MCRKGNNESFYVINSNNKCAEKAIINTSGTNEYAQQVNVVLFELDHRPIPDHKLAALESPDDDKKNMCTANDTHVHCFK